MNSFTECHAPLKYGEADCTDVKGNQKSDSQFDCKTKVSKKSNYKSSLMSNSTDQSVRIEQSA
jgi:hypothetical protein